MKKFIPIIAKIRRKSKQTRITFVIAGIEARRALTTSLRPSFLAITLRGLRALKALKAFRDFKALPPSLPETQTKKSKREAKTTIKSKMFHADLI